MKKTLIMLAAGGIVMAGLMVWAKYTRPAPVLDQTSAAADASQPAASAQPSTSTRQPSATTASHSPTASEPISNSAHALALAAVPDPAADTKLAFKLAMDTLISPSSTHEQRMAAWKQLKDSGQLDQAITQLQQLMAANPQSAEFPGDLAEAYLMKCSQTDDIRQQAILAMNADQLFDNALTLDPNDWEARFNKTVAMSHWPDSLGKGQDVINNFLTLIQQQQNLPPETQFALPYLKLGDVYQKAGDTTSAVNAWQQGATLYPGNDDLQSRLASAR
jgi:tetratricopeptide (TPR) repeat protein